MQYESTFNAIDNILRNEAGCSTELDYIEQTSWLLFLKYLDDLDKEREDKAILTGKDYKPILSGFMRWSQWAAPKTATGEIDTVNAMTGPDLTQFVDTKLFPTLSEFKNTASSAKTLEYKIGEIFSELRNKITSGYNLREIINLIDQLHFQSAEDQHEMSVLYESKIAKMGNAGRNGGEYYTPRPLIRAIVQVVDPKIGETVYDPACGSAGFLCEAFTYMKQKVKSTHDSKVLQEDTFFGKEKKPLPYIIATMNLIFHGLQAPNIIRGNTLAENLSQVQERDRKNVILANPPFGGAERGEVKQNFDINTSETAYMFMQHFIKMMKTGGRAGIVIKNTFLSNGDAASLRKLLMEQCNLHTILDLPSGVFQGAGVKTVVLFFDKGKPTDKIWYYQIDKHFTKTQPLTEADMEEFLTLQKTQAESGHSWTLDVNTLDDNCDLSVKNPNKVEERDERSATEIATSLFKQLEEALKQFKVELNETLDPKEGWINKPFADCINKIPKQKQVKSKDYKSSGRYPIVSQEKELISGYWDDDSYLYKHEKPVIIFGDHTKEIKFIDFDFVVGADGTQILSPKEGIDARFFYYTLLATPLRSLGYARHFKLLKEKSFPIPPLSEQKSIVIHLDAAFAKIDTLKKNMSEIFSECDALKQAILRQVFE